ncbi:Hypothetical predicted protein [Cloeon dipterum]|uniref:Lipocalin/cytosolic fatty-acid binding domain-containing protein n=1 Tax=Cloeon dipterum TaxID=197152 RepID=A0A8S1CIE9_9INSE|nr:Hypothetical predicted protein [Cloeon dipterum]
MSAVRLIALFVLAATLATVQARLPRRHQVLCSNLKPVSIVDQKALEGSWLTVESILLRNGYPESNEDSQSKVCVRTSIFDTSSRGLSMRSDIKRGAEKRKTGVTKIEISDPLEPGRWTLMAKRPSTLNSELMVVAVRPSEFLVLAYCQPLSLSDEGEDDRPALWVKVLGRPSAYGGVSISTRDLHSLRNRLSEMLGLRELNSVRYDTSC